MSKEKVVFLQGLQENLPDSRVKNAFYYTTDTEKLYFGDDMELTSKDYVTYDDAVAEVKTLTSMTLSCLTIPMAYEEVYIPYPQGNVDDYLAWVIQGTEGESNPIITYTLGYVNEYELVDDKLYYYDPYKKQIVKDTTVQGKQQFFFKFGYQITSQAKGGVANVADIKSKLGEDKHTSEIAMQIADKSSTTLVYLKRNREADKIIENTSYYCWQQISGGTDNFYLLAEKPQIDTPYTIYIYDTSALSMKKATKSLFTPISETIAEASGVYKFIYDNIDILENKFNTLSVNLQTQINDINDKITDIYKQITEIRQLYNNE